MNNYHQQFVYREIERELSTFQAGPPSAPFSQSIDQQMTPSQQIHQLFLQRQQTAAANNNTQILIQEGAINNTLQQTGNEEDIMPLLNKLLLQRQRKQGGGSQSPSSQFHLQTTQYNANYNNDNMTVGSGGNQISSQKMQGDNPFQAMGASPHIITTIQSHQFVPSSQQQQFLPSNNNTGTTMKNASSPFNSGQQLLRNISNVGASPTAQQQNQNIIKQVYTQQLSPSHNMPVFGQNTGLNQYSSQQQLAGNSPSRIKYSPTHFVKNGNGGGLSLTNYLNTDISSGLMSQQAQTNNLISQQRQQSSPIFSDFQTEQQQQQQPAGGGMRSRPFVKTTFSNNFSEYQKLSQQLPPRQFNNNSRANATRLVSASDNPSFSNSQQQMSRQLNGLRLGSSNLSQQSRIPVSGGVNRTLTYHNNLGGAKQLSISDSMSSRNVILGGGGGGMGSIPNQQRSSSRAGISRVSATFSGTPLQLQQRSSTNMQTPKNENNTKIIFPKGVLPLPVSADEGVRGSSQFKKNNDGIQSIFNSKHNLPLLQS